MSFEQFKAEVSRGADISPELAPSVDSVLMPHQAVWIADTSVLMLAEKARRTGITEARKARQRAMVR